MQSTKAVREEQIRSIARWAGIGELLLMSTWVLCRVSCDLMRNPLPRRESA